MDGDRFTVGSQFGDGPEFNTGSAYTGTVSSLTTLDSGTSAIIDGISFQSRTDWVIGFVTSDNHVELTADDSAEILEIGTAISIGANAGVDNNSLTISGSVSALEAEIGVADNMGNRMVVNSSGIVSIGNLTIHKNNSLVIEGNFATFSSLEARLNGVSLFAASESGSELASAENFDDLFAASFDTMTGFTTITPTTLILGDVNLDGTVNLFDVAPFIDRLAKGVFQVEADCNQDGLVNLLDVDLFIAILAGD